MSSTSKLHHDYAPMEALLVKELPSEAGWQYEPKWDGFRCLAFKEGNEVDLRSKRSQPLGRYFPEIVEAVRKVEAAKFVIDGELVVWRDELPSFDDLLQRIHPAATRIRKLAQETPAVFMIFDILSDPEGRILDGQPLSERRKILEAFAAQYLSGNRSILLSPATDDADTASQWLKEQGAKLDGIIAKRLDMSYQSGNRKGMLKVKRVKTADCVVGGFRYGTNSDEVGSLLLGLYDENGDLHHVGFSSSFKATERKAITEKVKGLIAEKSFTVNVPGGPSRWSTERSTQWIPLRPELVVEVAYDHMTNGRFRHGTKLLRWRPDKSARQCTFEQLAN